MSIRLRTCWALAAVAISACSPVRGFEHGNVAALPVTCRDKLEDLYQQHYYSTDVLPGTSNCTEVIQDTLANVDGTSCPAADQIRGCFNFAQKAWVDFVSECELFSAPPTCNPNGGPCARPISANPWWLRQLDFLWRPVTYDYGTGVVPNQGEGWLNFAGGEGEGTRRRYRRLFAEGEGGSAGSSGGCFPDFYSPQDFQAWLQGNYQSPEYGSDGAINPIGIIFWIVHALGILSMGAF